MKTPRIEKGPLGHRLLVWFFSSLFCLLLIWLIGFFLRDIDRIHGPEYQRMEEAMLDPQRVRRHETLLEQLQDTEYRISREKQRQTVLRDSTTASQATMNQLLEIQKLSLDQGMKLSEAEQASLEEAKSLFLSNQKRYQELNESISGLEENRRVTQREISLSEADLEVERGKVREAFNRAKGRHEIKLAAAKILCLLPMMGFCAWGFSRFRHHLYAPLLFAGGIAVLWHFLWVLHEHLSREYFKYILIIFAIALVVRVLQGLLLLVARPKASWLLKRFKEAYEIFKCPICGFPIRRGPLKFGYWTGRSLRRWHPPTGKEFLEEKNYHCPSCGSALFEPCAECGGIRHALLPSCEHCGAVKELFPEEKKN